MLAKHALWPPPGARADDFAGVGEVAHHEIPVDDVIARIAPSHHFLTDRRTLVEELTDQTRPHADTNSFSVIPDKALFLVV
jgi:hypothetical protein